MCSGTECEGEIEKMPADTSLAVLYALSSFFATSTLVSSTPHYDGCFTSKGCIGFPSNCVAEQNCEFLSTYGLDTSRDDLFQFSMIYKATDPSFMEYGSIGLSNDTSMGDDVVFVCYFGANSPNKVDLKWNTPFKNNENVGPETDTASIVLDVKRSTVDEMNICTFKVKSKFIIYDSEDLEWSYDLKNLNYNVMVAKGGTFNDGNSINLMYHGGSKTVSASRVALASSQAVGGVSNTFLIIHASTMIVAWLFFAGVSILLPRYMKTYFTVQLRGSCFDKNPKALWFLMHTKMVFMVFLLSVIGSGFVIAQQGFFPYTWKFLKDNPHPLIGAICLITLLFQVMIGLLRPHPESGFRRSLFNWVHRICGNIAYVTAIASIFLGVELSALGDSVNEESSWGFTMVLFGFVVIHVMTHLGLSALQCCCSGGRNYEEGKGNSNCSKLFHIFTFVIYTLLALIASVLLIFILTGENLNF